MAFRLREIQIAGIGPVAGTLKLELGEGLVSIYAPVGTGKSSVASAIGSLFAPGEGADLSDLRNRDPDTELFRVGALIEDNGARLRVMRDLATQTVSGSLRLADGEKTTLQDDEALLGALIGRMEFCLPDDWRTLFLWQPDNVSASGSAAAGSDELSDDPDELRRDMQELQEERMLLGSTQNVQEQVDDLQHDIIELEKQLEDVEVQVQQYDNMYEYIESRQSLQEAGEGLMERARNFNAMQKKYEDKLYRHEEKSENQEKERELLARKRSWFRDFRFSLSLAVFAGAIVAAGVTKNQLLALPGLLGIGFAGYLIWQYIMHAAKQEELDGKIKEEAHSFAKQTSRHEEAVGKLLALQQEYKLLSPEDLVKVWDELNRRRKELLNWQEGRDVDALRGQAEALGRELEEKRATYEQLNVALAEASGSANDLKSLDRQIRLIQKRLKKIEAGEELDSGVAVSVKQGSRETLVHGGLLAEAAARAGRQNDSATVLERLARRLAKMLPHFFAGVWLEAFWQDEHWMLRPRDGGHDCHADLLSNGEQRVLSALVRIGLWQDLPPDRRFPIVLDEPFAQVDDDTVRLLGKLLMRIASSGQVILLTGRRVLAPADRALSLS